MWAPTDGAELKSFILAAFLILRSSSHFTFSLNLFFKKSIKAPIKCEQTANRRVCHLRESGVKCLCASRRWEVLWHLCKEFQSNSE